MTTNMTEQNTINTRVRTPRHAAIANERKGA
jgi:hypothetical protein